MNQKTQTTILSKSGIYRVKPSKDKVGKQDSEDKEVPIAILSRGDSCPGLRTQSLWSPGVLAHCCYYWVLMDKKPLFSLHSGYPVMDVFS